MANDRSSSTSASSSSSFSSTPAPAATLSPLETVMAALAESQAKIAALMEQQAAYNKEALKIAPRRKKTMGEYLEERKKRGGGKRLLHNVYQNGRLVNPSGLSQETINLLDTLDTGKYCDGMIDVVRIRDGVEGINDRIHLMYNNGSVEERMTFYMRFPSFTKIVTDIAAEMTALGKPPVHSKAPNPVEPEFPENI